MSAHQQCTSKRSADKVNPLGLSDLFEERVTCVLASAEYEQPNTLETIACLAHPAIDRSTFCRTVCRTVSFDCSSAILQLGAITTTLCKPAQ